MAQLRRRRSLSRLSGSSVPDRTEPCVPIQSRQPVSKRQRRVPAETVAYKLIARQGQRLDGLRLEVVDERLRGRMEPRVHEFGMAMLSSFWSFRPKSTGRGNRSRIPSTACWIGTSLFRS